jgi:hypothetical protein
MYAAYQCTINFYGDIMTDSLYGRHLYLNVGIPSANFVDGIKEGQLSTDDATPANTYKWLNRNWVRVSTGGELQVSGLASNFVRHTTAVTYNSTDVLGLTILKVGTATLRLSPVDGGADVTISATELAALGVGFTFYVHCDEIETDVADTDLLLYI